MKKIKWFQRTMLILLIGMNTFVFTTMKGFAISDRIYYTLLFCGFGIISIFAMVAILKFRKQRKKSVTETP